MRRQEWSTGGLRVQTSLASRRRALSWCATTEFRQRRFESSHERNIIALTRTVFPVFYFKFLLLSLCVNLKSSQTIVFCGTLHSTKSFPVRDNHNRETGRIVVLCTYRESAPNGEMGVNPLSIFGKHGSKTRDAWRSSFHTTAIHLQHQERRVPMGWAKKSSFGLEWPAVDIALDWDQTSSKLRH